MMQGLWHNVAAHGRPIHRHRCRRISGRGFDGRAAHELLSDVLLGGGRLAAAGSASGTPGTWHRGFVALAGQLRERFVVVFARVKRPQKPHQGVAVAAAVVEGEMGQPGCRVRRSDEGSPWNRCRWQLVNSSSGT